MADFLNEVLNTMHRMKSTNPAANDRFAEEDVKEWLEHAADDDIE